MARQVRRPQDIPHTRRFDGKTFRFVTYEFGSGARDAMRRLGEKKTLGRGEHYRTEPYDVQVRDEDGRYRERRVWALYVHKR